MLGALVGNAIGSQVSYSEISARDADLAMKLQYNQGPSQNPGSIASGGEMILVLVNALSRKEHNLDLNQILAEFLAWNNS